MSEYFILGNFFFFEVGNVFSENTLSLKKKTTYLIARVRTFQNETKEEREYNM
jgi:hypothetical protein